MTTTSRPSPSARRTPRIRSNEIPKQSDADFVAYIGYAATVVKILALEAPKARGTHAYWEFLAGRIRSGFDLGVVKRLELYFDIEQEDLLRVLALSSRTYARRKSEGRGLDPVQSDRAYRLAKIGAYAEEVFEVKDLAHDWLKSYNRALGAKPIDLLDTQAGAEEVEQILGRIEHGVYS